jgi:glycosyltransferase involved in cell wall biosynthesis
VLEALAAGKPVVASPKALDGLAIVPGEHVLEASTPEQWIRNLNLLFESRSRCNQLAVTGREFVREHHRWENCLQPLAALIGNSQDTTPRPLCSALS